MGAAYSSCANCIRRVAQKVGPTAHILITLFISALLIVDLCLVEVLPLNLVKHIPDHGPPQVCGWDNEASWQIGIAYGRSPDSFEFSKQDNLKNPVLSCAHVTGFNVSYVATPFLVIPGKIQQLARSSITRKPIIDRSQWSKTWYLFYEMKNLHRGLSEIGVSRSMDEGNTWKHDGVALAERYSLSFPFVTYHEASNRYVMIPDSSETNSVRVYTTTSEQMPFGWRLEFTPLHGKPFHDTSAIHHRGRWYIFTSDGKATFLYMARDLLAKWLPHPKVPIHSNFRHARSAGPPVMHGGTIYRYAKDSPENRKIYVYRVDAISQTQYKEELVRIMSPPGNTLWNGRRMHHIDAHQLRPSQWIAVLDGDTLDRNRIRGEAEHWFSTTKLVVLVFLITQLVLIYATLTALSTVLDPYPNVVMIPFLAIWNQCLALWSCIYKLKALALSDITRARANHVTRFVILVTAVVSFMVPTFFIAFFTPVYTHCPEPYNKLIPQRPTGPSPSYGLENFTVVTVGSKLYFDRLQNFVGSVHYWEPGQHIVIYDIGLTEAQALTVQCWRNVEVRGFNYDLYPMHLRNAYNYAWKLAIIKDALEKNKTVLVLDSGVELRQPLDRVKQLLVKDGYFNVKQSNYVTVKTRPATFHKLGFSPDDFEGKSFCSGGLQGYVRDSKMYKNVFVPAYRCALDEDCIAPVTSGRENHNYDQSVVSILLHHNNYTCQRRIWFAEGRIRLLTLDETRANHVVFGLRRWKRPHPYTKHIDYGSCPATLPFDKSRDYEIIESTQTSRVMASSPLQTCLRQYNNSRSHCRDEIKELYENAANSVWVFSEAWLIIIGLLLQRTVMCAFTLMMAVYSFVTLLVIYVVYKAFTTKHPHRKETV